MGELALHGVGGGIRTLYEGQTLALQGRVAGPMTDFLRYVAQSPIGGWLHNGLGGDDVDRQRRPRARARDPACARRRGDRHRRALLLAGNDVHLMPEAPTLVNARARIDFTQQGVTVGERLCTRLGGELVFDGGSQPDGSLRFIVQGTATAEGLRRGIDEPALARLASHLNGQTSYRLQIGIARGQTEFALSSPMTGFGIALPAPLDKPADASWPLRVSTAVSLRCPEPAARHGARGSLERHGRGAAGRGAARSRRRRRRARCASAYALGAPLPAPQPGGIAVVRAASMNVDAWWALWHEPEGADVPLAPASRLHHGRAPCRHPRRGLRARRSHR